MQLIDHLQCWLRHPLLLRNLIDWPNLNEVFDPNLRARIKQVVEEEPKPEIAPWILEFPTGKNYYFPGSLEDLISFVITVSNCRSAFSQALSSVTDQVAFCPPNSTEIAAGLPGDARMMSRGLRRMFHCLYQRSAPGNVVLHADILHCFASIDTNLLLEHLVKHGASPAAVQKLEQLLVHWRLHGCTGLPFGYSSWPLVKFYLSTVDQALHEAGVDFLRFLDDYHLICRSIDEVQDTLEFFSRCLAGINVKLNREKTWVEQIGNRDDQAESRRRRRANLMKEGIARPLLAQGLAYQFLRPISVRALKMFRLPCYRSTPLPVE